MTVSREKSLANVGILTDNILLFTEHNVSYCQKCLPHSVNEMFREPSTLCFCFCSRYEQSEWGWKEREKREEMNDERAWYLLARDSDSAPVAFSHFRFDVECGEEVLYW